MIQVGLAHITEKSKRLSFAHTERAAALIKKGIWAYFFLLIFEGALRKWVVPGLATPLLVVRDPVALLILITAIWNGLFPVTIYAYSVALVGIVSTFTALFFGHGNIFVALFGARILVLHFPLMFVVGNVFTRKDILAIGKMMLLMAPCMTVLIALQFYTPQTSWFNRGVGGSMEGAGFSGALGFFRPPGTFSFTNGVALFYNMLAPFVLYFWLNRKEIHFLILLAATVALIAAIPLSISRALFFSVIVSCVFFVVAIVRQPRYWISLVGAGLCILVLLLLLGKLSFFNTATQAFSSRFEIANKAEGGVRGVLADRYLGGLIGAVTENSSKLPFFGYGSGMGTNVGSMLLTGQVTYLVSEGEWGRLIGEMGVLLGLLIIIVRVVLSVKMVYYSYKKLAQKDLLPWLLVSFALLQIPQGQWAQPTNLGFAVLAGGLTLAAIRTAPDR